MAEKSGQNCDEMESRCDENTPDVPHGSDEEGELSFQPSEDWGDCNPNDDTYRTPENCPESLTRLYSNAAHFKSGSDVKLQKSLSVNFSLDTWCTSQQILERFDKAGIDIDLITSIQRKSLNNTWVVSFAHADAKEHALDFPVVTICGVEVFLSDCQNVLQIVKVNKTPMEMPDTVAIGQLSAYGKVLPFRRNLIANGIYDGVRTARMYVLRSIPTNVTIAGEPVRLCHPTQAKTCRRCGEEGHLVKECRSHKCSNCEQLGHCENECPEPPLWCFHAFRSPVECPQVTFLTNGKLLSTPS